MDGATRGVSHRISVSSRVPRAEAAGAGPRREYLQHSIEARSSKRGAGTAGRRREAGGYGRGARSRSAGRSRPGGFRFAARGTRPPVRIRCRSGGHDGPPRASARSGSPPRESARGRRCPSRPAGRASDRSSPGKSSCGEPEDELGARPLRDARVARKARRKPPASRPSASGPAVPGICGRSHARGCSGCLLIATESQLRYSSPPRGGCQAEGGRERNARCGRDSPSRCGRESRCS